MVTFMAGDDWIGSQSNGFVSVGMKRRKVRGSGAGDKRSFCPDFHMAASAFVMEGLIGKAPVIVHASCASH